MSLLKLLLSEIRFRWINSLLCLLAVAAAATLFVGGPTLLAGFSRGMDEQLAELNDTTRKLMRDLGFNLTILHKDTDPVRFRTSFEADDMPEDYIERLAKSEQLTKVTHLVATLFQRYTWEEAREEVFLIGILPEVPQAHMPHKSAMGYQVAPGTVLLGHALAADRKIGETVTLGEQQFTIAQILPEAGSHEDAAIMLELHDAQQVLGKPGKINRIEALGCKCSNASIEEVRQQLQVVLPQSKVYQHETRAVARSRQRDAVKENSERWTSTLALLTRVTVPAVILFSALFVGLMSWLNVRERRPEIGLLRALGKRTGGIAALLMSKAVVLGLLGGVIGCLLGFTLALSVGRALAGSIAGVEIQLPIENFQPDWNIIGAALWGAPLIAAMASYLPTLSAVLQDPAKVLTEE